MMGAQDIQARDTIVLFTILGVIVTAVFTGVVLLLRSAAACYNRAESDWRKTGD